MYSIRKTPGKGLGLFATQRISRGQRILTDNSLLFANGAAADILRSAYDLSLQARQSLLSLAANPSKHSSILSWLESFWLSRWSPRGLRTNHSIINIFRNNNFHIGESVRAVFPQAARINHSCVPNSQGNYNTLLDAFTIHAVHDVSPGEEITISYLEDQLGLREWRQSVLLERYGFKCECAGCDENIGKNEAREARRAAFRQELRRFTEKSGANSTVVGTNDELPIMMAMLEVYEEEGIRGREAATLCIAAAKLAFKEGNSGLAHDLASKGIMLEKEAVGTDNPCYVSACQAIHDLDLDATSTA